MVEAPRRDEDGRSHWKLDSQLQSKQDQVAAKGVIIGTQRSDGTESMGQVAVVGVIQGDRPRPTVKGGSWKNAVGEVVFEVGVFVKEKLEIFC